MRLDGTDIRSSLGALQLEDSRYRVTNTFIGGASERVAIVLIGGEGMFRFVTVSGNFRETAAEGPIDCGDSAATFQESIVFGNSTFGVSGSQFRGTCSLDRVVVGADSIASPGAIDATPVLEDDYRLPDVAANRECCIDRATSGADVLRDIEGTRRPVGPASDLGAFEVN